MKKPKIGAVKCADSKRSRLAALLVAILAATMLPLAAHAKQDSLPGMGVQPAEYFYTGKPYDSDTGSYTFKYRNYDPELNRWTTMDPSGFPDGANSSAYIPIPTNEFDWQGLEVGTISANFTQPTGGSPTGISYDVSASYSATFNSAPALSGPARLSGNTSGTFTINVGLASYTGSYTASTPSAQILTTSATPSFTFEGITFKTWYYTAQVEASYDVTFSGAVGGTFSYNGVNLTIGGNGTQTYTYADRATVGGSITVQE